MFAVLFLLVSTLSSLSHGWDLEPPIDCWEECFHEGDYKDQESYKTFYQIGNYVKMHRLLENTNGTFFILDSTVNDRTDLDRFKFLKGLIKLLVMMTPIGSLVNPFHLGQFNQDFAW